MSIPARSRHCGNGGARAHARHEGGDRRPSVGRAAPVGDLRRLLDGRGVAVLEDTAQAAGARSGGQRAGSLGDAATFSFFPSKNLFCFGDGGAIATNDDEIAAQVRTLRFHGSRDKSTFTEVGWNSRLDALQAAVLRVTLGRLDDWNARRRALAAAYQQEGLGELVDVPRPAADEEFVHHLYAVRTRDPDAASRVLDNARVVARSYYRVPVHMQPAMAEWPPPAPICPAPCGLRRRTSRCQSGPPSPRTPRARWSKHCAGPDPDAGSRCKHGLHVVTEVHEAGGSARKLRGCGRLSPIPSTGTASSS